MTTTIIPLPAWSDLCSPDQTQPTLLSYANELTPQGGGDIQRLVFPGSRYSLDVSLPAMEADRARLWVAALLRSERKLCSLEWPQPGLTLPMLGGPPTLDGAVIANAETIVLLDYRGNPFKAGVIGQFVNVTDTDGRRYLHALVDKSGNTYEVAPVLRTPLADGVTVEFTKPVLEGWVAGDSKKWTVNVATHYGLSFSIKEDR